MTEMCTNPISCHTSQAGRTREGLSTCCLNCPCSDDCVAMGNCCHDNKILHNIGEPSCIFPYIGYKAFLPFLAQNSIIFSYLLVNTCSTDAFGQSVDLCMESTGLDLINETPVYSSKSKFSYRNKYCAQCNNIADTEYTDWKSILSC